MQILESSVIGLRSARITLTSAAHPIEVTLFPMIHIGEREFYEQTLEDALSHDVALIEGVGGPIAQHITRSYRWIVGSPQLGLVLQNSVRPAAGGRAKVIQSDLSPKEFDRVWRRVPFWMRWAIYLFGPIVALSYRLKGSREALAKGRSMEDHSGHDDLFSSPETSALGHALLDARDARLLEHLERLIAEAPRGTKVAVLYGAGHMRAVLRHLTGKRGYRPTRTEWRMVFAL